MKDQWLSRWNDRYANTEYAYGTEPNLYFKEKLSFLKPGKILFAAEGEGRNSVFAAVQGWEVSAFDISEKGREKALQLAENLGVNIDYQTGLLPDLQYEEASFDVIVLIFAHFPAVIKSEYHKRLAKLLKPGGQLIFEAFSKKHLPLRQENPSVGGPDNIDDLFSVEELQEDFKDFTFNNLSEEIIELNEGIYHRGKGSVIHFTATKSFN